MSIPLRSDDTVAITALEFGCNRALTFVDGNLASRVNITQYIITRYRMATVGYGIFVLDSLFSKLQYLLGNLLDFFLFYNWLIFWLLSCIFLVFIFIAKW